MMDAKELVKEVLRRSGMELDTAGDPYIGVAYVSFEGAQPSLQLDVRGDVEIRWPIDDEEWEGGYVNGVWRGEKDGKKISMNQGGAWIHKGGNDDSGQSAEPGDLYPYKGNENGTLTGPSSVAQHFEAEFLAVLYLHSLGPDATDVLDLLGERPEDWGEDKLREAIRVALQEHGADPDEVEEQIDERIEEASQIFWGLLKGTAAMDHGQIQKAISKDIGWGNNVEGRTWSQICGHIEENGVPDSFALIGWSPYTRTFDENDNQSQTFLLYGRTGWRGDPDLNPKDQDAVLAVLIDLNPDLFDDESAISIEDHDARNGWIYAVVSIEEPDVDTDSDND